MKKINTEEHMNFLKDLDNLSDEEEIEDDIFKNDEYEQVSKINNDRIMSIDTISSECNFNSKLLKNLNYLKILDEIDNDRNYEEFMNDNISKESRVYGLISKLNEYNHDINKEMNILFKELKQVYSERFPELASIIFNAFEYALTVKSLSDDLNISKMDLSYLPSNIQLTLNIMTSSTTGKYLNQNKLKIVDILCDNIIKLNSQKKRILSYIENKMRLLCPNLSALLGSIIAAKLVTAAGGIIELSKMPSNNVLVMGANKINLEGFSSAGRIHMGYLSELEEVQKTPEKHKMQILRKYAGKAVLMARVDAYRIPNQIKEDNLMNSSSDMIIDKNEEVKNNIIKDRCSKEGDKIKEEISKKMNKIIEPHQAVIKKPLPRPDEKPRRKRGGKRMRSIKERYALTEMRLMKNRMKFGPDSQIEYRESGKGFGLLGVGGTGSKIKTTAKVQKINTKKQKMLALESSFNLKNTPEKDITSGLHSSVAFTPVEGIELINPELLEKRYTNVKEKYFSSTSGFSTVVNNHKKKGTNTFYEI